MPGDPIWTHNGHFWQLFVQYHNTTWQTILRNDHCEQPEIAENK